MSTRYAQKPKLPDDPNEIELGKWYRLEPKNRNVKSFYGKAAVMFEETKEHEIVVVLRSYETNIAVCNRFGVVEKTPARTWWDGKQVERKLSCTSSRHFSEFRSQAEDFAKTAMQMMKNKLGSLAMVL